MKITTTRPSSNPTLHASRYKTRHFLIAYKLFTFFFFVSYYQQRKLATEQKVGQRHSCSICVFSDESDSEKSSDRSIPPPPSNQPVVVSSKLWIPPVGDECPSKRFPRAPVSFNSAKAKQGIPASSSPSPKAIPPSNAPIARTPPVRKYVPRSTLPKSAEAEQRDMSTTSEPKPIWPSSFGVTPPVPIRVSSKLWIPPVGDPSNSATREEALEQRNMSPSMIQPPLLVVTSPIIVFSQPRISPAENAVQSSTFSKSDEAQQRDVEPPSVPGQMMVLPASSLPGPPVAVGPFTFSKSTKDELRVVPSSEGSKSVSIIEKDDEVLDS